MGGVGGWLVLFPGQLHLPAWSECRIILKGGEGGRIFQYPHQQALSLGIGMRDRRSTVTWEYKMGLGYRILDLAYVDQGSTVFRRLSLD